MSRPGHVHDDNPYLSRSRQLEERVDLRRPRTALNTTRSKTPEAGLNERHAIFHKFLIQTKTQSLPAAIDTVLNEMLGGSTRIWMYNATNRTFALSSSMESIKSGVGIVNMMVKRGDVLMTARPEKERGFDASVDLAGQSTIYIPLYTSQDKSNLFCVAQVTRDVGAAPFSSALELSAMFFMEKFGRVAPVLIRSANGSLELITAAKIAETGELVNRFTEQLKRCYKCKEADLWMYDTNRKVLFKYVRGAGWKPVDKSCMGATTAAVMGGMVMNVTDVGKCANYKQKADGRRGAALLVTPTKIERGTFAVSLRDKNGEAFSCIEAHNMTFVVPALAQAMINDGGKAAAKDLATAAKVETRLKALLETAEILSGVLDIDTLIPIIMKKARALLDSERCSLFLLDSSRRKLVSRIHGGLEKSIEIPVDKGLVGFTATTGEIVNTTDPYSDERFNQDVDMETGFTTKSLLTTPVYDSRGTIVGVAEMINKNDGSAFDEDDIKLMMTFNVFCGISLDNAKLYTASLDLMRQLRSLVATGNVVRTSKEVMDALTEIVTNVKSLVSASRVTIFLRDIEADTLSEYLNVGDEVELGTLFASKAANLGKVKLFKIDAESEDGHQEVEIFSRNRRSSFTDHGSSSGIFDFVPVSESGETSEQHPVCDVPMITGDSTVLGVLEVKCGVTITGGYLKLLECLAVFATVVVEKSNLEEIVKLGEVAVNMHKWITEEEKNQNTVPEKFRIPEPEAARLLTANFNAPHWDGMGIFKVLWHIMDTHGLLCEYNISNERFFCFLSAISQRYNQVPYHNWRHACDVTQFVSYQIEIAKLNRTLTKFEIMGMIIAAICHDVNHDGFTNIFNVKAETPLGILFKNQSVMETHHCRVCITVMSEEECNLFHSLSSADFTKMWTLLIRLILITDMAKHFEFVKILEFELEKGPLNWENEEHRLLAMQALIKCGDISNVSRPFELADKWCDVLCEEFFRQGDLEMANGMEYTSPLNDREHLDKPKSQIGFYNFVCLPLYKITAKAIPALRVNVDQIESNLAVWTRASEEKEAA